jgi:hypothetical protein
MSGYKPGDYLNQSIENILVDSEMLGHIATYTMHCAGLLRRDPQAIGHFEDGMRLQNLSGIIDYWVYDSITRTLYVSDFKYGFGWVEVFENWQLLAYAVLVLNQANPKIDPLKINLGVVQPRANHPQGPIRTWEIDIETFSTYAHRISAAINAALSDVPITASGAHCRYCPALLHCHTAQAAAGCAIDYAGFSGNDELTPEELGLELETVQRASVVLSQKLAALETLGMEMVRAGKQISGWECRQSAGNLAWNDGSNVVLIAALMGVDVGKPVEPITPTQAMDRELLDEKTVKQLATRKPGSLKFKKITYDWVRELLK